LVTAIVQHLLTKLETQICLTHSDDILQEFHSLHLVILLLVRLQWLFNEHALRHHADACHLLKIFKEGSLLPALETNYKRGAAAGVYRVQPKGQNAIKLLGQFLEFLLVHSHSTTIPLALDIYLNGILVKPTCDNTSTTTICISGT
jgi:hypothetical protein